MVLSYFVAVNFIVIIVFARSRVLRRGAGKDKAEGGKAGKRKRGKSALIPAFSSAFAGATARQARRRRMVSAIRFGRPVFICVHLRLKGIVRAKDCDSFKFAENGDCAGGQRRHTCQLFKL